MEDSVTVRVGSQDGLDDREENAREENAPPDLLPQPPTQLRSDGPDDPDVSLSGGDSDGLDRIHTQERGSYYELNVFGHRYGFIFANLGNGGGRTREPAVVPDPPHTHGHLASAHGDRLHHMIRQDERETLDRARRDQSCKSRHGDGRTVRPDVKIELTDSEGRLHAFDDGKVGFFEEPVTPKELEPLEPPSGLLRMPGPNPELPIVVINRGLEARVRHLEEQVRTLRAASC